MAEQANPIDDDGRFGDAESGTVPKSPDAVVTVSGAAVPDRLPSGAAPKGGRSIETGARRPADQTAAIRSEREQVSSVSNVETYSAVGDDTLAWPAAEMAESAVVMEAGQGKAQGAPVGRPPFETAVRGPVNLAASRPAGLSTNDAEALPVRTAAGLAVEAASLLADGSAPALALASAKGEVAVAEDSLGVAMPMNRVSRLRASGQGLRAVAIVAESGKTPTKESATPSVSEVPVATRPSPVAAVPTLPQMMVENPPARNGRAVSMPVTPVGDPVEPASDSALGFDAVPRVSGAREIVSMPHEARRGAQGPEFLAKPFDQASRTPGGAATEDSATPVVERPVARGEVLAGEKGRTARPTAPNPSLLGGKQVQESDRKSLREASDGIGTRAAEEPKPMTAHAPVLPPATAGTLGVSEPAATVATPAASRPATDAGGLRSQAAVVVRETIEAAEKMQEVGRNHLELRVQTGADESLRIHLRWNDGVLHARFVTQSNEMQQALSQEWEHAAPRMAEKGLKFGEASFEQRHDQSGQSGGQNAFGFEHQQRQSPRGQGRSFDLFEEFAGNRAITAAGAAAGNRGTAGTKADREALPLPAGVAEKRNLSAWA